MGDKVEIFKGGAPLNDKALGFAILIQSKNAYTVGTFNGGASHL
jgi:hypothetical protein